jgi:hypothetical protein
MKKIRGGADLRGAARRSLLSLPKETLRVLLMPEDSMREVRGMAGCGPDSDTVTRDTK